MYWNRVTYGKKIEVESWIVTLDVLKYGKDYLKDVRKACWIVTLDVLKFNTVKSTRYKLVWLNSNIRCIEINEWKSAASYR